MRKLIFGLLLAVIVFASCEKEEGFHPESFVGTWTGKHLDLQYEMLEKVLFVVESANSEVEITEFHFGILGYADIIESIIDGSNISIEVQTYPSISGIYLAYKYSYEGIMINNTTIEMQISSYYYESQYYYEGEYHETIVDEHYPDGKYTFILTKNQDDI